MRWGLHTMEIGDSKFFEYNEFSKDDIVWRLGTVARQSKNKFKIIKKKNGVECVRVS
jgi:hypothetical protein